MIYPNKMRCLSVLFIALLAVNCRAIPEAYYVADGHVFNNAIQNEPIEVVLGEERVIINETLYTPKKVEYSKHYTVYRLDMYYLIHYKRSGILKMYRNDQTEICTIFNMQLWN